MSLIAFDLDDTLMWCGKDYSIAKKQFGEFIADVEGVDVNVAVETFDELDRDNVNKFGLSRERFPQSAVDAYVSLVANPTEDGKNHVRNIGYSVFKTAEEYAERGLLTGAEELLSSLKESGFSLHLITAGVEEVQRPKIDGLQLENYFDEIHITGFHSKSETLSDLMKKYEYGPDETFLIGNSLSSDIRGALDSGAYGVYIPGHEWNPTGDEEYYQNHERVFTYTTLEEVADDCPDVFTQNDVNLKSSPSEK